MHTLDSHSDVMPEPPIPEALPFLYTEEYEYLQQSLVFAKSYLERRNVLTTIYAVYAAL